jgi:hypothetical protein
MRRVTSYRLTPGLRWPLTIYLCQLYQLAYVVTFPVTCNSHGMR